MCYFIYFMPNFNISVSKTNTKILFIPERSKKTRKRIGSLFVGFVIVVLNAIFRFLESQSQPLTLCPSLSLGVWPSLSKLRTLFCLLWHNSIHSSAFRSLSFSSFSVFAHFSRPLRLPYFFVCFYTL